MKDFVGSIRDRLRKTCRLSIAIYVSAVLGICGSFVWYSMYDGRAATASQPGISVLRFDPVDLDRETDILIEKLKSMRAPELQEELQRSCQQFGCTRKVPPPSPDSYAVPPHRA